MQIIIDMCSSSALDNCLGTHPSLTPLLGRELLGYTLERLKRAGAESALLCCDRYVSEISDYCESCGIMSLTLCESECLEIDDDILVVSADYYYTPVLPELFSKDTPAVLVCSEAAGSELITFKRDSDGDIISIDESSEGDCFAGAVYLPRSLAHFYTGDLSKALSGLFKAGAVLTPVTSHFSARLTDTSAFLELQRHMLNNAGALSLPELNERVYSEDCELSGVTVEPPVYIGRNVSIAPGTVLGPYTVIEDDVLIERRVAVSGAYIGARSVIGAHSVISDAAVFSMASVGAAVRINEGAAIGSRARIFDNAVICAGVSVYAGKKVFEGAYICDDLTQGSISKRSIDDEGCCSLGSHSSPSDFLRFGAAVATALPLNSTVAVAHNGTPAAADMCGCLRMGLAAGGCRVLELGEGSKQLLAFTLSRCKLPLGCYVTSGSENNISLMAGGGLPLTLSLERAIERAYSGGGTRSVPMPQQSVSGELSGIRLLYEDWLRSMLPSHPRLSVSVRCPNKQLQLLADSIFSGLEQGSGESIVFHISHDGSACSAYSQAAGYILHDRLLLLALKNAFKCSTPVSVPYAYTSAADLIAGEEGGSLYRYYSSTDGIEDKEARECAARIDNLFVRDGLALAAYVTMLIEKSDVPFEQMAAELPDFYCTRRYVGLTERAGDIAGTLSANKVGTGAEYLCENGRAVVRRVKGSRGLMVFAESFNAETAMSLCDQVTAKVKGFTESD